MPGKRKRNRRLSSSSSSSGESPAGATTTTTAITSNTNTNTTNKRGGSKKNLFQSPSRSQRRRQARRNRTQNRGVAKSAKSSLTTEDDDNSHSSDNHTISGSNSNSNNSNSSSSSSNSNSSSSSSSSNSCSSSEETPIGGKSVFSGFWTNEDQEEDNTKKGTGGKRGRGKKTKKDKTKKSSSGGGGKKDKIVEYEGFFLTIGDVVYSIGVGDVVAMRNSDSSLDSPKKCRSDDPLSNPPESPRTTGNAAEESQTRDRDQDHRPPRDVLLPPSPPPPHISEYTLDAMEDEAADYYGSVPDDPVPDTVTTTAHEDGKMTAAQPRIVSENVAHSQTKPSKDDDTTHAGNTNTDATMTDAAMTAAVAANIEIQQRSANSRTQPLRKKGDGLMLARVERIWTDRSRGSSIRGRSSKTTTNNGDDDDDDDDDNSPIVLFQARWFLQHRDVASLPLGELRGPTKGELLAETVTPHDIVLSNQSDENHVTTICDIVQVLYRNPDLEEPMPPSILPSTYQCRYSLVINDTDPQVVVLPYTGENDPWHEMSSMYFERRKRTVEAHKNRHQDSEDEKANAKQKKRPRVGDYATPIKKPKGSSGIDETPDGIDEGTTEQRDIQIGKRYQVPVPPFVPNQRQSIRSRNPVQMWNPHKIDQEVTDEYLERCAKILSPYLRTQQLTTEEPYQPFPTQRMEELSQALETKRLPTLSSVSSGVSLSTKPVDALREFDIDYILRNLHVSNYDVEAAIRAIEASPKSYLVAWNRLEKLRFNTGFRRYSGSLRAIHKGLGGDKKLTEVIDYHYRFKIPDQFRRIQERKREQAVRMLECLETRRNLNAPIVISNLPTPEPVGTKGAAARKQADSEPTKMPTKDASTDWTKTSVSSLVVSLEERRVRAKELLLDVEAKLGRTKMLRVFEVFKNASDNETTTVADCKTKLIEIFRGHRDFQTRFLEFLPQPMRL